MANANKLLVGAGCLLLFLAVFFKPSHVNTELRPPELGALPSLYASAAPYALVTPIEPQSFAAATSAPGQTDDAVNPAPVQSSRDLLAEYVRLHKTRPVRLASAGGTTGRAQISAFLRRIQPPSH